jgi:hypothetical protein
VHRQWGGGLRALGDRVLEGISEVDVRLIIAALDGLRLTVLTSGEVSEARVRAAIRRQLEALLG